MTLKELKFHLSEIRWGNALVLILALAAFFYFTANVPVQKGKTIEAVVKEVNQTHGSKYELPYPLARVVLSDGATKDITLPREVYVRAGQTIILQENRLLLSGKVYSYASTKTNP
jgi:hypothetical protein